MYQADQNKELRLLPMKEYELYYKRARKYLIMIAKDANIIVPGVSKFSKKSRYYIVIPNGRLEPLDVATLPSGPYKVEG